MLERTAACLESGSLRRLIPGSKKPMKTQRMLHSTFWIHGAGELDLPPLWSMLLGEYDVNADDKETKGSFANTVTSGFLLDFLYPAGTASLLRQISGWNMAWRGSKQGSTRFGHRLFSSGPTNRNVGSYQASSVEESASRGLEDASGRDGLKNDEAIVRNMPAAESLEPAPATLKFRKLLESSGPELDYAEVWHQFHRLPTGQQGFVVSQVIKYLSASSRPTDLGRVTSLLDLVPPEKMGPSIRKCGMKAFIATGRLEEAVEFHRMALQYKQSSCSAMLIAAQLKAGDWESACETHTAHVSKITKPKAAKDDTLIYEVAKDMPDFAVMSLDFAKQVNQYLTQNPPVEAEREFENEALSRIKGFATLLATCALVPPAGTFSPVVFARLFEIVKFWNADSPKLYKDLIWTLKLRNQIPLAISTFRDFRQRHPTEVQTATLRAMVEIFCDIYDVEGIQEVLDDFFAYHEGPDEFAYKKCMSTFAAQGDAKTVEALFEQFTERFKRSTIKRHDKTSQSLESDEFTPLLNVYAKRGELLKVISLFDELESRYGLKPTVICWNILINAYGKVADIDGAFERFQQMLSLGVKPDHYTIGTLMGICAARGDSDRTLEVFEIGRSMGIPTSTAMIDCLVLAHIQDENLEEAQIVCEKAINMDLRCPPSNKFPLTRMWNQLLTAYAFRRDLQGSNLVIQRMQELGVEFDMYTYSALMQGLAMTRQSYRAWALLTKVMPEAGVRITSFHYAVVMGGFLATGHLEEFFKAYELMLSRNIKPNASTSLAALKASAMLDQQRIYSSDASSEEARFQLAENYFDQLIRNMDPHEMIAATPRKGMGRDPVDVSYQTAVYRYMIFVHGSFRMMDRVKQLYAEYVETLPEYRRDHCPPIRMLEALMKANLHDENYKGVEQCWELALESAKKEGSRLAKDEDSDAENILYYHRYSLSLALTTYIHAMGRQDKFQQLHEVLTHVQEIGFALDVKNWNIYVQWLVRGRHIQQAFNICETKLMDNWTGWKEIRWAEPVRNRLPMELRYSRMSRGHVRPVYYTLLCLARAWLDANEAAAENLDIRASLSDLEKSCPRVVAAVESMPRTANTMERRIMTSDEW